MAIAPPFVIHVYADDSNCRSTDKLLVRTPGRQTGNAPLTVQALVGALQMANCDHRCDKRYRSTLKRLYKARKESSMPSLLEWV